MAVYPAISTAPVVGLEKPFSSFHTTKYLTSGKAMAMAALKVAKSWKWAGTGAALIWDQSVVPARPPFIQSGAAHRVITGVAPEASTKDSWRAMELKL